MNEWVRACSSFKTLHEHSPTTRCQAAVEKAGDEAHEKGLTSFLMVCTCDPSAWKMGTEGWESKGIFSELKASLGYIGMSLGKKKKRGWKRFPESKN